MGFYDVGLKYDPKRATPRTLTDNDLKGIVATAGWRSGTDFSCAQRVVIAESSKQTAVVSDNPDGNKNIGIFQIDTVNVKCGECLKDPVYNANVARRMWLADGRTFSKRWETAAKGNLPAEAPGLEDDATNPVDTTTRAVSSGINAVGDFFNLLGEGSTWRRVGFVVGGGILVTIATLIIAGEFVQKVPVTPIGVAAKALK